MGRGPGQNSSSLQRALGCSLREQRLGRPGHHQAQTGGKNAGTPRATRTPADSLLAQSNVTVSSGPALETFLSGSHGVCFSKGYSQLGRCLGWQIQGEEPGISQLWTIRCFFQFWARQVRPERLVLCGHLTGAGLRGKNHLNSQKPSLGPPQTKVLKEKLFTAAQSLKF